MNNTQQPKTGLALPIFIMIAPVVALLLTILLWAAVYFVFGGMAYDSGVSPETSGVSNTTENVAVIENDPEATQPSLFDEGGATGTVKKIANILTFLIGAYSILGFIPSIVVGIVMINKRLELRRKIAQANVGFGAF